MGLRTGSGKAARQQALINSICWSVKGVSRFHLRRSNPSVPSCRKRRCWKSSAAQWQPQNFGAQLAQAQASSSTGGRLHPEGVQLHRARNCATRLATHLHTIDSAESCCYDSQRKDGGSSKDCSTWKKSHLETQRHGTVSSTTAVTVSTI